MTTAHVFKRGFTLVELSLSVAFIGILSIMIALIINNAIVAYRRGLTLNKINTVGMDVVDDMRAAVQNSSTTLVVDRCATLYTSDAELDKCNGDNGLLFVSNVRYGNFKNKNGRGEDHRSGVPLYGVFCTGTYSYVWNSGYYFSGEYDSEPSNSLELELTYGKNDKYVKRDFRLLKVRDNNRAICIAAAGGYIKDNPKYQLMDSNKISVDSNSVTIVGESEQPYDLFSQDGKGDSDLAIYDLTSTAPAGSSSTHSLFYSVSFILGTVRGGINVKASGDYCKPPEGYDSNFDYCAINKFNFAIQATGG